MRLAIEPERLLVVARLSELMGSASQVANLVPKQDRGLAMQAPLGEHCGGRAESAQQLGVDQRRPPEVPAVGRFARRLLVLGDQVAPSVRIAADPDRTHLTRTEEAGE